ncbi:MAG: hypothetical protein AB7G65_19765 [Thermoleophilia bacterium]
MPAPSPSDVVVHMPVARGAVGDARATVRRHLADISAAPVADAMVVVAAELVTTSLLAGEPSAEDSLRLRLSRGPRVVGVEVTAASTGAADGYRLVRRALSEPGTARGLRLVDALSTRWGLVYDDRAGTRLWAELETPLAA